MCEILGVSRSGYYAFYDKQPSKQQQANEVLDAQTHIKGVMAHPEFIESYKQGNKCGRHRVARRLRVLGLKTRPKRRFVTTTDSRHSSPVSPNLLGGRYKIP